MNLHSAPLMNESVQVNPPEWRIRNIFGKNITMKVPADRRMKKWKVSFGAHSDAVNQAVDFP